MSYPRPDELATKREIEKNKRNQGLVRSGINTAVGLGTALIGGSAMALTGMARKILPFLSDKLPVDLALKGLNKVSPEMAKILEAGMKKGLNVKDGINFIKEKLESEQAKTDKRNVVEQESPELHNFIQSQIKEGDTPIQAAAKASVDKNFGNVIKKLVKANKTTWGKLVESLYKGVKKEWNEDNLKIGSQDIAQSSQPVQSAVTTFGSPKESLAKESSEIPSQFEKQPQISQATQPEITPAMQQLLQTLQDLKQSRAKRGR